MNTPAAATNACSSATGLEGRLGSLRNSHATLDSDETDDGAYDGRDDITGRATAAD